MKTRFQFALLIGFLALGQAAEAGSLSLRFIDPERFIDGTYSGSPVDERSGEAVQRDIREHLEKLAERKLPADTALEVEVLDIDLAGRVDPLRTPSAPELRVVRSPDWPRMTLRYVLKRGDRVLLAREEKISDMGFDLSSNRYSSGDRLRYEKAMLDDWFARRFAEWAPGR